MINVVDNNMFYGGTKWKVRYGASDRLESAALL